MRKICAGVACLLLVLLCVPGRPALASSVGSVFGAMPAGEETRLFLGENPTASEMTAVLRTALYTGGRIERAPAEGEEAGIYVYDLDRLPASFSGCLDEEQAKAAAEGALLFAPGEGTGDPGSLVLTGGDARALARAGDLFADRSLLLQAAYESVAVLAEDAILAEDETAGEKPESLEDLGEGAGGGGLLEEALLHLPGGSFEESLPLANAFAGEMARYFRSRPCRIEVRTGDEAFDEPGRPVIVLGELEDIRFSAEEPALERILGEGSSMSASSFGLCILESREDGGWTLTITGSDTEGCAAAIRALAEGAGGEGAQALLTDGARVEYFRLERTGKTPVLSLLGIFAGVIALASGALLFFGRGRRTEPAAAGAEKSLSEEKEPAPGAGAAGTRSLAVLERWCKRTWEDGKPFVFAAVPAGSGTEEKWRSLFPKEEIWTDTWDGKQVLAMCTWVEEDDLRFRLEAQHLSPDPAVSFIRTAGRTEDAESFLRQAKEALACGNGQ